MKLKNLVFGAALFFAGATTLVTSCTPDACKDVVCQNNGTCDLNGNCVCPTGFQGVNCEIKSNSVFTGSSIQGDDTCIANSGGLSYDHTADFIADAANASTLEIVGFADYTCIVSGVSSPLKVPVTIDKGNVTVNFSNCGYGITGSGKVETVGTSTKMTIDYTAVYNVAGIVLTDKCRVIYTK
jgi:hypothetical protein